MIIILGLFQPPGDHVGLWPMGIDNSPLRGCCLGHPAFLLGAPNNPGGRAKMPFTLSYKSQIVTRPYKSLFNFFLYFSSFRSVPLWPAIRGSAAAAIVALTVLCCCCFFLLLLLWGKLSFFFCCCCLFVVVTACSPYWLHFSWCLLHLSSPSLVFSVCVHCVFS